jgi:hypothetical protein
MSAIYTLQSYTYVNIVYIVNIQLASIVSSIILSAVFSRFALIYVVPKTFSSRDVIRSAAILVALSLSSFI